MMKVHNPPGGDPERTLAAAARMGCVAELSPADCRVLLARLRASLVKVHNPPWGYPDRTMEAAALMDYPAELSPADCRLILARLRSTWAADLAAVVTGSGVVLRLPVPDTDVQEGGE